MNFTEKIFGVAPSRKDDMEAEEKLRLANQKVDIVKEKIANNETAYTNFGFGKIEIPAGFELLLDQYIEEAKRTSSEIRKLHEASESEAYKLNEEYNKLITNIEEAKNALKRFEEEKLGMKKGLK